MTTKSASRYQTIGGLQVDDQLRTFVERDLLADLDISAVDFWRDLEQLFHDLLPVNQRLLAKRAQLQAQLDDWNTQHKNSEWNARQYQNFLRQIGYLVPEGEAFTITTENVDAEIARIAGPQLVVPVSNARFALNAANARWGSLYDALYGTDVISEEHGRTRQGVYNPVRGAAVMAYAAEFLDQAVPFARGSHKDVQLYKLFHHNHHTSLLGLFADGSEIELDDPQQFVGFQYSKERRLTLLFQNNRLHFEIVIDPDHTIGMTANAHVADVILESAVTTIQDCEDSVAAVDAADKTHVYANWLGLMRGTLTAGFSRNGKQVERALKPDREYRGLDDDKLILPGRSLLLVRNVGHLMTCDAVLDTDGNQIPEGILDAVITSACALYDLRQQSTVLNSRQGSVYIVKPKMHGPEEVAFADQLFARVEDMLGLTRNTLKIGVMDEERRTTVNLAECIRAVRHRLVFINTGFLDRTGDEIHTSMHAGVMLPKDQIKDQVWIDAYERWNVDVGIRCGLPGKAQIGKGMWAKPDELKQMIETKIAHLEAGANCAWVPSPTAATLHALHYHYLDVLARQRELSLRTKASLADILTPPLASRALTANEIRHELRNSCQSILGYVVRWIDQGVGCSKVPDIDDVGLMEDRATLRISSQLLANWLLHGVCTEDEIVTTMQEMAAIVDRQNRHDPDYRPMSTDFTSSIAFAAACDLVLKGVTQPSGYTEPLLHQRRRQKKLQHA